jgi:hypothetical protein
VTTLQEAMAAPATQPLTDDERALMQRFDTAFAVAKSAVDQPELVTAEDGSITIYVQAHQPKTNTANWLPVPEGHFSLLFRVYGHWAKRSAARTSRRRFTARRRTRSARDSRCPGLVASANGASVNLMLIKAQHFMSCGRP